MQFNENIFLIAKKHPFANYLVTIVVYFCLIISCLATSLSKGQGKRDFSPSDVFFYFIYLTVENPSEKELILAITTVCAAVFVFIITFGCTLFVNTTKLPFTRTFFVFFWVYVIPMCMATFLNVFALGYYYYRDKMFPTIVSFGLVLHVILVFIVITYPVFCCSSSTMIIHPCFIIRNFQASIVLVYFVFLSHFCGYYRANNQTLFIIRLIIGVLMTVYGLILPPYYNRLNNILYLFMTLEEITTPLVSLLFTEYKPRFKNTFYALIADGIISLIVYFAIYPFIIVPRSRKKRILNAFISGKHELALEYLEAMRLRKQKASFLGPLLLIAVRLRPANLKEIIAYYTKNCIESINDISLMWSAANAIISFEGHCPHTIKSAINTMSDEIDASAKKFWQRTWSSNIYLLPSVASKIGRHRYYLRKFYAFNSSKYPSLKNDENINERMKQEFIYNQGKKTLKTKILDGLTYFDILSLLSIIFFLVGHSTLLISSHSQSNNVCRFLTIRRFISCYINCAFVMINASNYPLKPKDFADLISSYKNVLNLDMKSKSQSLTHLEADFVPLVEKIIDVPIDNLPFKDMMNYTQVLDSTLVTIYENFQQNMHQKTEILNAVYYISTFLMPLITIIVIIFLIRKMKKDLTTLINIFKRFPKEKIERMATIDTSTEHNLFNGPKTHDFSLFHAYPATFAYYIFYILLLIIMIALVLINRSYDNDNNDMIKGIIENFGQTERIPLWTSYGITFHFFSKLVDSSYENQSIDGFLKTDQLYDSALHDIRLKEYTDLLPPDFFKYIGDALLISPNTHSIENWTKVLFEANSNFNNYEQHYDYISQFIARRFVAFYFCTIILYVFLAYIIWEITPMLKSEQYEIHRMFTQITIASDMYEESITKIEYRYRFKVDKLPLLLFVVNRKGIVIFATNIAQEKYSIRNGDKLYETGLPPQTIADLELEITRLDEAVTKQLSVIEFGARTLILNPVYNYEAKKIRLDYALIVAKDEAINAVIDAKSAFGKLFYSVYPSFVRIDQKFPIMVPSKNNQYLFLLTKLRNFHNWASEANPLIVSKFRQQLSEEFCRACHESEHFCKIRESPDFLVAGLNHETTVPIWYNVKNAGEFGKALMKSIHQLYDKYQITTMSTYFMIMKCVEPKMYLTDKHLAQTDYQTDVLFTAEEYGSQCIPDNINFVPIRKEGGKVMNTSKLKTCYSSSGSLFDIFLVV